ncbi:MAG: 4-(cytidine 5'-diphospho)-2-C-methyl-D-erythritol kinase, partial [Acidobacteriota bacterium]
ARSGRLQLVRNVEDMLTLQSYAKINWTLEILGRRPDGYHELRTILQTVDLADTLHFTPQEREISVHCDHPEVPTDERNLVWKAASLLRQETGIDRGVRVEIVKRIPTAAGLGGGSSNAAVTLLALLELWEIELPLRQLFALGSRLGADVPFFFIGGTCLGVGRGDEVYPLVDIEVGHLLLVNAGILVPTRDVYANLPPELTNPEGVVKMPLSLELACEAVSLPLCYVRPGAGSKVGPAVRPPRPFGSGTIRPGLLKNDLEIPVLPRYPRLAEVRQQLIDLGAGESLMSGSGSTVFAIFDNDQVRQEAAKALQAAGWWVAPVGTISRDDYASRMTALSRIADQHR